MKKKMNKKIEFQLIKEGYHITKRLLKYNASVNTDYDLQKMQYTLLRENHVIEKGMSMRSPKKGYGQAKVELLIHRLLKYYKLYGEKDKSFLFYPLSTIAQYIKYTTSAGVNISHLEKLFNELLEICQLENNSLKIESGIKNITKEEIINCIQSANYEKLVKSRHSIRYFTKDIPDLNLIKKALELAQQTPSACNRQGWMVHVFLGHKNLELLNWQSGANGFSNEIQMSILITANMKAFLSHEPNQAYIDGGLYAMNLLYAIHAQGLGTIPLSCGFYQKKLDILHSNFEVPENEVPIMIIGVGCLLDNFNIAVSSRKSVNLITTIHK